MDGEGDDRFSEHTACYLRPGGQETRGHKYSLKLLRRLLRDVACVWPALPQHVAT